MKDNLIQLTQQIIDSIEIAVDEFQVYSENDTLPKIIESIQFQSDYLICVWVNCPDSATAKEQYESFLHKPVYIIDNNHHNVLYWFEGFRLKSSIEEPKDNHSSLMRKEDIQIESIKNSSILPTWLQQRIFKKHKAQYAPDHKRYEHNLNLSNDELKVYLGTYFPRSYGESFCIFENIFENENYANLATKEEINILDIGSGTGGNLIGLLVAINKYSIATKKIKIIAVDGHSGSLAILSDLIENFANKVTFTIKLTAQNQSFISAKELEWITVSNFDFIMSSKMGCELIKEGNTDSYYDLTKFCLPKLSETGLFLLLDVTTKVGITYNPILMNLQVNRAIMELDNYKTLIPISCGEFEKECIEQCFTQRTFFISHSYKMKDKSKVTYRIIANSNFVNQLISFNKSYSYINIYERDDNFGRYCIKSNGKLERDNYKI